MGALPSSRDRCTAEEVRVAPLLRAPARSSCSIADPAGLCKLDLRFKRVRVLGVDTGAYHEILISSDEDIGALTGESAQIVATDILADQKSQHRDRQL